MPASTSPLSFPYPLGPDMVADGDNVIQALAEAVDDYLAGASADVTYGADFGAYELGTMVYRRGGIVVLNFSVYSKVNIPGPTPGQLLQVPAGFRPTDGRPVPGVGYAPDLVKGVPVWMNAAGWLELWLAVPAGTEIWGSMSWPI